MTDDILRLAFAGLHPDRLQDLLAERGSPTSVLAAIKRGSVWTSPHVREAVAVPAPERRDQLAADSITALAKGDPGYPVSLADLPRSPELLFVRGSLPAVPGVAVVGTRRCTSYGKKLAHRYGEAIAAAGWPLVSGLARGIDGAAHRGTVDGGGIGVAVLGCGLDVAYPREHRRLGDDLLGLGGAIVSENVQFLHASTRAGAVRTLESLARIEAGAQGGALVERVTTTRTSKTGVVTTTVRERFTPPDWHADGWFLERRHPADWSRRTELVLPDEQAVAVDPLVGVHDELRLARLARQKQQGRKGGGS